jgi:membrane-associated phospholipid phosphatase
MLSPLLLLVTTLAVTGGPLPAQALPAQALPAAPQDTGGPSLQVQPLRFNGARDGALTSGAAALLLTSVVFKDELASDSCRWCDRNAQGEDTLNGIDRWGLGIQGGVHAQHVSRTWSNVVSVGILPISVLGAGFVISEQSGASGAQHAEDLLMVAQAVLFSAVANQGAKYFFARERPFVHALPPEERPNTDTPQDNNLSFYSGHSSYAFALVTATGTLAHLRGYRHQGWIWAVGMPIAAAVPLLRMGAGKHYLTDVATGALVGSAFGVGVPLLLHPRQKGANGALPSGGGLDLSLSAGPGSFTLSGRF